jgi:DNA polymerase elongation subunit (family B)
VNLDTLNSSGINYFTNNINTINNINNINNINSSNSSSNYCYNDFMQRQINQFPIIRIFGTTYRGQKCCLNIHNYFPYFYVEITNDNYFPLENIDFLRQFAFLLESTYLRFAEEKKVNLDTDQEKKNSKKKNKDKPKYNLQQVIHKIEVIEKYKFYGYSKEKSFFLKIFVYEPKSIKFLMDILHNSIIRGRHYQCYEAHLSYSMHFFADYNLYGMGLIKFTNFSFRYDTPDKLSVGGSNFLLTTENFLWLQGVNNSDVKMQNNFIQLEDDLSEIFFDENLQIWDNFRLFNQGKKVIFNNLKKSSKSCIEIDIDVKDILNEKCENVINLSIIKDSITQNIVRSSNNFIDNECLKGDKNNGMIIFTQSSQNSQNLQISQNVQISVENLQNSIQISDKENSQNINMNMNNISVSAMLNLTFNNFHTKFNEFDSTFLNNPNLSLYQDNELFKSGQEVDINNLKHLIRYQKTLIELWEDEISRREVQNLPKLTFEKISNQNNHTLIHNEILKNPDLSNTLISFNTKSLMFDKIILLNEELEFKETSQELSFQFFISEERMKSLLARQNKLMIKRWYTGKFKTSNFFSMGKKADHYNLIKNFENKDKDHERDSDDINDIMSTISEISMPNSTRNKIREVMTTRSIEEFFSKSDDQLTVEEANSEGEKILAKLNDICKDDCDFDKKSEKLENKFSLLKSKSQTISRSDNKIGKKSSLISQSNIGTISNISKSSVSHNLNFDETFINLYRNLYSFRKVFPTSKTLFQKLILNRDYVFNLKFNRFLLCLYYSNFKDYVVFTTIKEKHLQINTNRLDLNGLVLSSHSGLNFFLQNYNKVTEPVNQIRSKEIMKRRERISEMVNKYKEIVDGSGCYFDNLKVLTYVDLIFVKKSTEKESNLFDEIFPAPKKNDVVMRIDEIKKRKFNKKNLNEEFFKKKLKNTKNNEITNQNIKELAICIIDSNQLVNLPQHLHLPNENNLLKTQTFLDKTFVNLNYTYNNEISPITDKKQQTLNFSELLNENENINVNVNVNNIQNFNTFKNPQNLTNLQNFKTPLPDIIKKEKNEVEILKNIQQISNLTIFSVEVQCEGREDKVWHHESDQILSIFCSVHDENAKFNITNFKNQNRDHTSTKYDYYKFIITTQVNKNISTRLNYNNQILLPEFTNGFKNDNLDLTNLTEIFYVKDEFNLIMKFIEIFNKYDPDFVVGYETEVLSIAYITRRGEFLGIPVNSLISRMNTGELYNNVLLNENLTKENFRKKKLEINLSKKVNKDLNSNNEQVNSHKDIKYLEQKFGKIVKLRGRVIINLWRVLECELKLINYKIENVVFNVLKVREAQFDKNLLLEMYKSGEIKKIIFVMNYYMKRANYNLMLLEELDLINRDVQFTKSKIFLEIFFLFFSFFRIFSIFSHFFNFSLIFSIFLSFFQFFFIFSIFLNFFNFFEFFSNFLHFFTKKFLINF